MELYTDVNLTKLERRNDIDWVRILAMIAVFSFHCGRFFDQGGWHVKNFKQYAFASMFTGALGQWIMPLFFVISGISTYYALDRGASHFTKERIRKLLVPLVFGIFILAPSQVYLERFTSMQFKGSFIQFLPHYFDGFYAFGGNFAWMGLYLWYLEFLFLFSMIALPLFLYLKRKESAKLTSAIAKLIQKPGMVFLPVLPLAVFEIILDPKGLGIKDMGGWNLFIYFTLLLMGFIIASDQRNRAAIEKNRYTALAVALLTYLMLLFMGTQDGGVYNIGKNIIPGFIRVLNSWSCVIAFLGFGSKSLNYSNSFLKYANEALMPFYVLHQTVIILVGYFIVIKSPLGDLSKYFAVYIVSFVIIMVLYHFVVRKFNILRFLFGMKAKRKMPV
jgi:glucans biosynthesis protein C